MSRDGWHPHIESALQLDAARLLAHGILRANSAREGIWRWGEDENAARVSFSVRTYDDYGTLTLRYTLCDHMLEMRRQVVCGIHLSTTELHCGGLRWWLHCPYTRQRARKLYKFGGIDQFCHRLAIRPLPTYRSQRISGVARIQERRWAIRRKLRDDITSLLDEPLKPKWMRWRTFERYQDRDSELQAAEDYYLSPFLLKLLKT